MLSLKESISPREEVLAYETLWSIQNQSIKSMAELFRQFPGHPSDVLKNKIEESIWSTNYDRIIKEISSLIDSIDGISICLHGTSLYPKQLRSARHPIELFYYKGDIGLTQTNSISIVGARKCSPEGKKRASRLAKELVNSNYTIVSGIAEGIDTAAMTAAIEESGKVIGVIGTPINQYYPKQNKLLQDNVAKEHLLISQVPFYRYETEPFTSKRRYFPERNETMAALSDATVIVEASETSGTHSQARACIEKGKPLFILSSCFDNKSITWPEKYLEKGAIRVRNTNDILVNLAGKKSDTLRLD